MDTVQPTGNRETWAAQGTIELSRSVLHASWFQERDTFGTVCVRTSCFYTFDFWDCLIIGNPRPAAPPHKDFCIQQLSCLLWILKRDERAWMFPWQDGWMELVESVLILRPTSQLSQSPLLLTGCKATLCYCGIFFVMETSGMGVCNFFGWVSVTIFIFSINTLNKNIYILK